MIPYFGIIILLLLFFLWMSNTFDNPERNFLDFEKRMPPPDKFHDSFGKNFQKHQGPPTQYGHTALVYIIGVISSLLFAINNRLQKVEKDKIKSELSLLKAQINPHFLFNTLNSIYALAIKKDNRTAESIVQLSELMRYIMSNIDADLIELDKEINYINNYILLQKSRLGDTVKIYYTITGNTFGKKITPLILISFIENAFKHGVNPEEDSEINININIAEYILTLFVSNKKVHSVQSENGIGLQNTMDRLSFLYPDKHTLEIKNNASDYRITLKIDMT